MIRGIRCFILLVLVAGLTGSIRAQQADTKLAPLPELRSRVTDTTGTLTGDEKLKINGLLQSLEERKGAQLAVLVVATTEPEAIEM